MRSENKPLARQLIQEILRYKRRQTAIGAYKRLDPYPEYGQRAKHRLDGRIRTVLSPVGTETGRLSSKGQKRGKEWWPEPHTNLQNLSKKVALLGPEFNVRQCIIPSPGMAFVAVDFSAAEARLTAAYANDVPMLKAYEDYDAGRGPKVYTWMASKMYQVPAEDVDKGQYAMGKMAVLGLGFGLGANGFYRKVNKEVEFTGILISQNEAQEVYDLNHRVRPRLKPWWQELENEVRTKGYLVNCLGRRRDFFAYRPGEKLYAYLPQSTNADNMNRAIVRVEKKVAGFKLLLQIHDELLGEVPLGSEQEFCEALRVEMEQEPLEILGRTIHIPAEASYSTTNWGEMIEL